MGVPGLYSALQPISKEISITDLGGMILGIDGYGWMHRATMSCAHDLIAGKPSAKYIEYFERRVNMMQMHNIKPYFVFDGDNLAIKSRINSSRDTRRRTARAQFQSDPSFSNAKRALDITTTMAASVCAFLRARGVPVVVAPFEADAQLVYLEQNGIVDAILSEDSDLVIFGAQKLVAKYKDSTAVLVDLSRLGEIPLFKGFCDVSVLKSTSFLRYLAILSGCDYSSGCAGIGIIKAAQLLRKCGGSLEAALTQLKATADFRKEAQVASICFQYQRVWDPRSKQLDTLTEVPSIQSLDAQAKQLVSQEVASDPLSHIIGHENHNFRKSLGMVCPQTNQVVVLDPTVSLFIARAKRPPLVPIKQPNYQNRVVRFISSPHATQMSPFFQSMETPVKAASVASSINPLHIPVSPATPLKIEENIPPENCLLKPCVVAKRVSSVPSPNSSPIRAHTASTVDDSVVMGPKRFKANSSNAGSSAGYPPKLDLSRFMYSK